ncbi:MAG: glutamyl-tRNA reductase [Candidatus Dormibacteria bacterium]
MHLLVEGLNHRAAPLSVRERVFIPGDSLHPWLARLDARPGLSGGAILSTCNRTEFYVTGSDPERAREGLRSLVGELDAFDEWERHRYQMEGQVALAHMFRVPAGLDSAIVGEGQILGQFKAALGHARQSGAIDPRLDFLMRRAISAAKRVRTETAIGRNPVGYGHAAVEQARSIFGGLRGRSALLVGAGKMAGSTARLLAAAGMQTIHFSTRTASRAMELAATMPSGTITLTVPFSQVEQVAAQVDLVICSTTSEEHLFSREMVAGWMRQRRHRPLFLLDLAVPRDIAPDVAEVEDAYLYNVDDLALIIDRGLREREREVPLAEGIIREEVERAWDSLGSRGAGPTIASLVSAAEESRADHVRRNLPRDLTAEQVEQVERLTQTLVAKLLHAPISYLRERGADPDAELTMRELFALDGEEHL